MRPKLSSRGLRSIIATKLIMSTFELFKLLNRFHNVKAVDKLITFNLNWGDGLIFKSPSHKHWLARNTKNDEENFQEPKMKIRLKIGFGRRVCDLEICKMRPKLIKCHWMWLESYLSIECKTEAIHCL